jgi:elongation factor P
VISVNDFRTGMTIDLEDGIYAVIEFQHVKPGKGSAFVRSKLRNIRTGSITERTFRAGEKVNRAHLDRRETQYLYASDDTYTFMDVENFEQIAMERAQIEAHVRYLKENMTVFIVQYETSIIGIELPNSVELKVVETDPGVRGDTATSGTKPAKLETGLMVQVPLFINIGDFLRIDTRSGLYIERV